MFDVAIVGFGPSGAVAAGLLGARGIRVLVIDKSCEVYDKPRAIALDHEILRLFQQLGVLDKVLPYMEPFTDSVFLGVDGQEIKRMSTVAPPYPMTHPPSVVFSQPPVETVLREHAASLPSVTVRLGCELLDLQQTDRVVTLQVSEDNGAGKQCLEQVQARYLIGADGARSTVRNLLAIELEDLGFDERWLVVDLLMNQHGLSKIPATSMQYCHPQRPASMIIGPGMHRRWEITLQADEDPEQAATEQGTWTLLAPWVTRADGQLWRQAAYRFHALVASQWRVHHVFLAGDAAHQQPPFLGQGMCQGLRDVANLSWKLVEVIQARQGDSLLDSYGLERKAHVTELTTRIKGIGQLISQRDLVKARERDAALLKACDGKVQAMPRQDVQPALTQGVLSQSLVAGQVHAARGSLFPQAWLLDSTGKRVRMDQVLGYGWRVVLATNAPAAQIAAEIPQGGFRLTVATLGTAPLIECEGVIAAWFKKHAVIAAIVRPDHYVYGVYNNARDLIDELKQIAFN